VAVAAAVTAAVEAGGGSVPRLPSLPADVTRCGLRRTQSSSQK